MEYTTDGMAPVGKPNPLSRLYYAITSRGFSKTFGLLLFLIMAAGVPTIAWYAQKQTNIQQKASGLENGAIYMADANGNPASVNSSGQLTSPNVYLKIVPPDGWGLPGQQSAIQKSSPIAYSTIDNIIPKVYAAACASPAVCSPSADPNMWTKTEGVCPDYEGESGSGPQYCYIRNSGGGGSSGGSTPTATPTTSSSGGGGTTNGASAQCVSIFTSNPSWLGQNITVRVNYGGNPSLVKFWISNEIGKTPGEVNSWTAIDTQNIKPYGSQYQLAGDRIVNDGFQPGQHAMLIQLLTSDSIVLDENRNSCTDTFELRSGTTQPTATPTQTQTPTITSTPTTPVTTILRQIVIQNADGGSGGHEDVRITAPFPTDWVHNGYLLVPWTLNTTTPADPNRRVVKVNFYEQPGSESAGRRETPPTSVAVDFSGITAPTPTRTPFGCEKKPSEMGSDLSDSLYRWVQVNRENAGSQPISSNCHDGNSHDNASVCVIPPDATTDAQKNSQCPQNTTSSFVNASTSNWCRNTPGENDSNVAHCWQLRYIGSTTNPPPPAPTTTTQPGAPTATVAPTGTGTPPSPTGTVTPTGTGTPPTPTSSVTPPVPGPSKVTITLTLSGISAPGKRPDKGSKSTWNTNPTKRSREITIYLYEPGADTNNDPDGDKAKYKPAYPDALVWERDTGKFVAKDINLGEGVVAGQYQIFVKTPGYLRKRVPGVQTIAVGSNIIRQEATLALGDANGDNMLDALDYRVYLDCLNKQTTDCVAKADFNDDGRVDVTQPPASSPIYSDYALFASQFSLQEGD